MVELEKYESLGYLANYTARLFSALVNERLAPLGILPAYLPVLFELWEGQALSQHELVEKSAVAQATMANTLNRMERDGLIERIINPQDARSRLIRATAKAMALQDDAKHAARSVNESVLSVLDDNEISAWVTVMQKVIAQQKAVLGRNA